MGMHSSPYKKGCSPREMCCPPRKRKATKANEDLPSYKEIRNAKLRSVVRSPRFNA